VTQLRKKMLEELQRRNYSHRTARTYVRIVRDFAEYFHQPPDKRHGCQCFLRPVVRRRSSGPTG
jgi:hypothetical protein